MDTPASSTNKTHCHDITKILLKVALNTINQAKPKPETLQIVKHGSCSLTDWRPPLTSIVEFEFCLGDVTTTLGEQTSFGLYAG